jgi:solute:Na+ symporter, SSS family
MIDIIIITSYLLITLLIGLYAGKSMKGFTDFAVGGRNYGSWIILATLSASFMGGGYTFGISEKVFRYGIPYIICLLGFSLQQIIVAILVAPKMGRFKDALSVGDIMDTLYGKSGRLISGFASVLVCIGIVGAQVNATGYVFDLFLGIDRVVGIWLGCGIVIVYSMIGGMRSVVATDILQFGVLIIAIPMGLAFGISYVGGFEAIVQSVPKLHLEVPGSMAIPTILSLFLSLLLGETLVPPYVQRLFIAKNTKETKRGILWSGLLSIPFFITAGCIGLVALTMNTSLDPDHAMPHVLEAALPAGLRGIAVAGVIAVIMSSADSYLNAASVAVVQDIVSPLREISSKAKLHLARVSTLFIGLGAIFFALTIESVLDILLYSYNFWAPVVLVPMVGGILNYKVSPKAFVMCVISGILGVCFWNLFFQQATGLDGLVIGALTNGICFFLFVVRGKRRMTREKFATG